MRMQQRRDPNPGLHRGIVALLLRHNFGGDGCHAVRLGFLRPGHHFGGDGPHAVRMGRIIGESGS